MDKKFSFEDIRRLNYIMYTSFRQQVKSPHSLFVCYVLFFARTIYFVLFQHRSKAPEKNVLFVCTTLNNRRAIKTVTGNLSKKLFTAWESSERDFPQAKTYLCSVKYLPLFQRFYNASPEKDKALVRTFYYTFMTTCGCYEVIGKMFTKASNLKMIVFTNDHNMYCRCMIEQADIFGIETLYVQHASVTERFPSLKFTYSFLDGMESYEKYRNIGRMSGEVYLLGSPRFDEIASIRLKFNGHNIGVALNLLDSMEKAKELCYALKSNTIENIVVRPHPRMENFPYHDFKKIGVQISDPQKESPFTFLSNINILIANESSIHLDSAIMGVPSVLYNMSEGKVTDWYSYLKNGLMPICKTPQAVLEHCKGNMEIKIDKVRYYNAAFGTSYEGKVGQTVASFIHHVINGKKQKWYEQNPTIKRNTTGYYEIKV